MFGQCMTESSYIECTSSAVKALSRFQRHFPNGRVAAKGAIARACAFLRAAQKDDGSYPGFWGINFTYAGLFVTEALSEAGASPQDAACARAAGGVLARQ